MEGGEVTITEFTPIADEWSIDDLEDLPPGIRAEVHNGNLYVMSPARLWHQHVESTLRDILVRAGRFAFTQVGVLRTRNDARVADIGVFYEEPTDLDVAWHDPATLSLIAEVWSPSSDKKDRNPSWYADQGIPQYWLAVPIKGEPRGAQVTMYELTQTPSGTAEYVERRRVTLAELERDGLG
jgi:Uma2 family endonuclease